MLQAFRRIKGATNVCFVCNFAVKFFDSKKNVYFFLDHISNFHFSGEQFCEICQTLTCLGGCDIDDDFPSGRRAHVRYSVLALHSEAVVGVWLQVCDQHHCRRQTVLARNKVDAAATRYALPAITRTLPAVKTVGDVAPASTVPGWGPLQSDTGLIDGGDGVLRSRRRT